MYIEVLPGLSLPRDLLEAIIERGIDALNKADGESDNEDGQDAEEQHQGMGEALWDGEPSRDIAD